jgi:MFS family permease
MQDVNLTREKDVAVNKFLPFIICFSASLFFFYEFIQGNMFASIADNLMKDFHIDAQGMTYLSSIYYLSNVLFLFIAGYVLDHYSPKKTLLIAMLICVLSTFVFASTQTYWLVLLCRFLTGIGSAFCFLGPIRVATHWFPIQRMATVTGLIVTFAMTGGILSQYPLTCLVMHLGWRASLQAIGWLGLILWGVMCFGVQENPKVEQERLSQNKKPNIDTFKSIYFNPQIISAALYTSLMNMAVAVLGAMMGSLYLMQRLEILKPEAALINSMLFLGAIVGGPLMGWTSDRLGRRVLPMKLAAVVALIIVLMIMYFPFSKLGMGLAFFALGLITSAQVISYALVAEMNSPRVTAMAISVISILTQGGYVIYQNLFSYILTHAGWSQLKNGELSYSLSSYQTAAIIFPLGLALAYLLLRRLDDGHQSSII